MQYKKCKLNKRIYAIKHLTNHEQNTERKLKPKNTFKVGTYTHNKFSLKSPNLNYLYE